MTVSEGPGAHNTRIVKTKYPKTEGTDLGTSKISGRTAYLYPKGIHKKKSVVSAKLKVGL